MLAISSTISSCKLQHCWRFCLLFPQRTFKHCKEPPCTLDEKERIENEGSSDRERERESAMWREKKKKMDRKAICTKRKVKWNVLQGNPFPHGFCPFSRLLDIRILYCSLMHAATNISHSTNSNRCEQRTILNGNIICLMFLSPFFTWQSFSRFTDLVHFDIIVR